jgi:hypothetical protein
MLTALGFIPSLLYCAVVEPSSGAFPEVVNMPGPTPFFFAFTENGNHRTEEEGRQKGGKQEK